MTVTAPYPCSHGFPNAAACIECMAEGPIAPPHLAPAPADVDKWIVARFNSRCSTCGGQVVAQNERIGFTEAYGWVCQSCGEGDLR